LVAGPNPAGPTILINPARDFFVFTFYKPLHNPADQGLVIFEITWLKTMYVLFFIELGTRRVHLAVWTTNPNATWVTQQARQLVWYLKDDPQDMFYLIHDNDKKFSSSFGNVFFYEGIKTIHTPIRAPKANAFAERWVRSIR
jgi:putative transposase